MKGLPAKPDSASKTIPSIDQGARERGQDERRDLTGEPDDAEQPGRAGHAVNEPRRRDLREPGPDQRQALADEVEPVVPMPKRAPEAQFATIVLMAPTSATENL